MLICPDSPPSNSKARVEKKPNFVQSFCKPPLFGTLGKASVKTAFQTAAVLGFYELFSEVIVNEAQKWTFRLPIKKQVWVFSSINSNPLWGMLLMYRWRWRKCHGWCTDKHFVSEVCCCCISINISWTPGFKSQGQWWFWSIRTSKEHVI